LPTRVVEAEIGVTAGHAVLLIDGRPIRINPANLVDSLQYLDQILPGVLPIVDRALTKETVILLARLPPPWPRTGIRRLLNLLRAPLELRVDPPCDGTDRVFGLELLAGELQSRFQCILALPGAQDYRLGVWLMDLRVAPPALYGPWLAVTGTTPAAKQRLNQRSQR
jgi:hypothetical protein